MIERVAFDWPFEPQFSTMLKKRPQMQRFSRRLLLAALPLGRAVAASIEQPSMVDPALRRAMEALAAAIPKAEADPERPVYHFRPPANWTNDPNGTILYKGWHHLFYQLNPYGSLWANMHWGHARSRDLVNWEHLPIALWPTGKEETAIFSGGAILAADGRPRLFYTSIGRPQPEQWMAAPTDDDLIGWEKPPSNPVLTQAAHGGRTVSDWRDPFLFKEAGVTYMVCGGNSGRRMPGSGQVHLYRAENEDLTRWRYLGPVFEYRDREIANIECPNLFKLGGKWVLIISPHRPCEYFVGELDLARAKFFPETHGVLDPGDAYASNISVDDKGRTILWLWGRTNLPAERGWNGVMVMPRILSLGADGFLRQHPAPEFESLRGEEKTFPAFPLGDSPRQLEGLSGDTLEILAEFSSSGFGSFGFELRRSPEGKPAAVAAIERGSLIVGAARTYVGMHERYRLRLFLDKGCLEAYVNDGFAAVYCPVAATPKDQGIALFARASGPRGGAVRLESLKCWPLKPARFDLSRFKI